MRPHHRDLLRDLRADPDFFGIVAVARSVVSISTIDRQTATLLATLREPGTLPDRARQSLLRDEGEPLIRLVLDDVLQIETDSGFVGGCAALSSFPALRQEPSTSSLERLSVDALRYAASLRVAQPVALAYRLYSYGAEPANATRMPLRGSRELAAALGLHDGALARAIQPGWRGPPMYDRRSWWVFSALAPEPDHESLRYKIYVSPTTDVVRDAMTVAIPILKRWRCPAFKIGGTPAQLLRPDKFVAYFADEVRMLGAAEQLAIALRAIPAQGVPFTAAVDDAAIVSWGIDPPASAQTFSWETRDSWRTWVTRRLAWYVVGARRSATSEIGPWEFALARLRLDGVDTRRWTMREWSRDSTSSRSIAMS